MSLLLADLPVRDHKHVRYAPLPWCDTAYAPSTDQKSRVSSKLPCMMHEVEWCCSDAQVAVQLQLQLKDCVRQHWRDIAWPGAHYRLRRAKYCASRGAAPSRLIACRSSGVEDRCSSLPGDASAQMANRGRSVSPSCIQLEADDEIEAVAGGCCPCSQGERTSQLCMSVVLGAK